MRWTVSIPKPETIPPSATGLDGEASSLEQAAHALVQAAREFLHSRQRAPSSSSVEGHIDGKMITIEGLLDPARPEREVVEQIISVAATTPPAVTPSAPAPEQPRRQPRQSLHPGNIETQLARLQHWAQTRLDRNAFTPATDIDLDAVEHSWAINLPADLRVLFRHVGEYLPTLMPGYDLLTVARSNEIRTVWLSIGTDQRERIPEFAAEFDPAELSAEPAGSACELFLPEFIPVADRGETLFVDTRAGDLTGCVSEYSAEGASDGWLWPSITAMFAVLADSVEEGTTFLGQRPVVRDRTLFWQ
ncbi:SMI1/KNR4 family protein [Nocardia sp. NPDC024068]|uniref:SMI1/KNR4 family protein n=1 Tax=Nocardia sp. NPDC024068 TaxID=3157197 RepID=UPI0033FBB2A2